MAVLLLALILVLLIILYYFSTKSFTYWKKKKVPYPKPVPLFGNYAEYCQLQKYYGLVCQSLCKQFPNEPYFGTYYGTAPALVVQDPEIIKLVFTKDFYYFNSRELMGYNNYEVTTRNLFFSHGDKWKVQRQNMTPMFSSAKLKNMFYLIEKCAFMFESMLDHETSMSDTLEARALMIRYTMDCICSCAFGVEADTQAKDYEKNIFTVMGQKIFGASYYSGLKCMVRWMWPQIFYGLGFKYFPTEIDPFFHKLLTGVFESRQYKPSTRNDFVDLILGFKTNNHIVGDSMTNLKTGGSKKIELEVDDELLVSLCVLFFGAGFETSAGALSLTIYELAKDQEAQRRAHEEIDEYLRRHNNKLDYDCITQLPYLEGCVYETLRLYPVLGILSRQVVEDYTFPSGLKLEKGVRVHLPVYHLHHNPDNFPEPEKYQPERFLPGAKHTIKPYTFFPFGEGGRLCIGMRFSKMQVLPGLITFLKKFHVELAQGTPSQLELGATTFLLQPANPLDIKVTPRSGWENRVYAR